MDLSNMNAGHLLIGGGLIAAMATGWGHIKSIASYISSFVIIKATVNGEIAGKVRPYLVKNWKQLPSGLLIYASIYLPVKNKNELVPYRITNNITIFRKGWRFIFLDITHDEMVFIQTIRGMVNIDSLIEKSITFTNELLADSNKLSRYNVVKRVGTATEKISINNQDHGRDGESTVMEVGGIPQGGYSHRIDTSIDKSLRFSRSELFPDRNEALSSVYIPKYLDSHIEKAANWAKMQDWYSDKNIPWRMGWLLHGKPGTGKTTLTKSIAKYLGIPIYQFYLSTMRDDEFIRFMGRLNTPCILLLEDFDNVFDKRTPLTEHKSLTFDCVLNELSGVNNKDGVFLIITTNDLSKIDEAIGVAVEGTNMSTRPGRIDTVIEVKPLDLEGKNYLSSKILRDWPEVQAEVIEESNRFNDITVVQFQELCLQKAFNIIHERGIT